MSLLIRFVALIAPLVSLLGGAPHITTDRFTAADAALLSSASLRLGHSQPVDAIRWLNRRPGVASASLGPDRTTVEIHYADGSAAAILPNVHPRLPVAMPHQPPLVTHAESATAARALVLEPFAGQLYSGNRVGDPEVHALQSAGFAVDQLYDGDVTMSTMASLSQYSVVYMLTHSGVNTYGEGVIATGQVADGDPSVKPFLDDRTAMVVGIYGSTTLYYGVLSGYFRKHMGQFPAYSLVFINGCSMLKGTLVWNALNADGVSTMVSWDNEAMSDVDSIAAQSFFASLADGKSILQAIGDVYQGGHGLSTVDGVTARFGYLGDPNVTLHEMQFPPTPTPAATPTLRPSPTPTSTPVPTASIHIQRSWPRPAPLRTAVHGVFRP